MSIYVCCEISLCATSNSCIQTCPCAVGIISRADADELLHNKPLGSYLIRVSVKIWGYTVSVKCELMEMG